MKIKLIHLQNFKRFTDLKIQNIPATAKLVVLLGPNGCGKSSLFDAFYYESLVYMGSRPNNPDYYEKIRGVAQHREITFHDAGPSEKSFYMRTAYRNQPHIIIPEAGLQQITQQMQPSTMERRFNTMIENDEAVFSNFQRLTSNAYRELIKQITEEENRSKNVGQLQDEILGMFTEIQDAMRRLFTDLVLNDLDVHLKSESKGLTFDKGTSRDLPYGNLSGGEKAAFDLLFDIFIKREEYDDTVFCIDEPEAHMNPRLQGSLLEELFHFVNDKSQLWIATHAIGMMRKALQLHKQYGEQVIFLDFSNRDFDSSDVIEPTEPDRRFWEQTHEIALDDLAALVAPEKIIICESDPNSAAFDARCYNKIFAKNYPDALFVSAGGKSELNKIIPVLQEVIQKAEIFVVRDRDGLLDEKRDELIQEGIRVLNRRRIEDYLIDDEVLKRFANENGLDACQLQELKDINGDNTKARSGQIYQKISKGYGLIVGDDREEFLSDVLAPLFSEDMAVYQELEKDIFGP